MQIKIVSIFSVVLSCLIWFLDKIGQWKLRPKIAVLFILTAGLLFAPHTYATTYTPHYPPAYDAAHTKATTDLGDDRYRAYLTTDPAKSLIGDWENNEWLTNASAGTNRFHIDLGSAYTVTRIYYENAHSSGQYGTSGVHEISFWGSNEETSFNDLAYGNDAGWTPLTLDNSILANHPFSNTPDPHFILVTNSNAYRYYAFKIITPGWGDSGGKTLMGIRRIELQTSTDDSTPTATLTPEPPPPSNGGGSGDGQSDGRSDGLSSCPSCTAAPISTNVPGTSTGQVLGASTTTLAATGSNDQLGRIMMGAVAALVVYLLGHALLRANETS